MTGTPARTDSEQIVQSPTRPSFDFSRTSYIRTGSDQTAGSMTPLPRHKETITSVRPWEGETPVSTAVPALPRPWESVTNSIPAVGGPSGSVVNGSVGSGRPWENVANADLFRGASDNEPGPPPTAATLPAIEAPSPSLIAPPSTVMSGSGDLFAPAQIGDNFAAWLFDSPGSQPQPFDLANLPYFDFGIDYSPNDLWTFDPSLGQGPRETHRTPSIAEQFDDPAAHLRINERRMVDITHTLSTYYMRKRPPGCDVFAVADTVLYHPSEYEWPNLTKHVLESCIAAFWNNVARQLPIVHRPTFSCSECKLPLLLGMIALGAVSLVRSNAKGTLADYRSLADLIIINIRWEIFMSDDAQPPVELWVAQALLFLELYEKMHSSRALHERAHIHHASTITLLRRGSPMIGGSGDETPNSAVPTRAASPAEGLYGKGPLSSSSRWWQRWVQNESMHRVVFAAFQMDSLHAVLFGHESVLLPYEVRLPLPCDDALWTAKSPDEVRRLEQTFSMHGIKPINFLDGLKRCLHGQDVQSHHNARLILVAGLLSVGWHIKRRDKHSQFLETLPIANERERWRHLLFKAYGHWRRSFETALGSMKANNQSGDGAHDDAAAEPTMLESMASVTSYIDIIDVQIFAGSKRLLGRKVSRKDHAAVVQRMHAWAKSQASTLATIHAYKALHTTLAAGSRSAMTPSAVSGSYIKYACRADPLIYRPWILYLSALAIWAYQYALRPADGARQNDVQWASAASAQEAACQYLNACAAVDSSARLSATISSHGCAAVLRVLAEDFATGESELLNEASRLLKGCANMLFEETSAI